MKNSAFTFLIKGFHSLKKGWNPLLILGMDGFHLSKKRWNPYYAKFWKSELRKLFRVVNLRLAKWVRNKYRKFRRRHWFLAYKYLQGIAKSPICLSIGSTAFSHERCLYHEEPYGSRGSRMVLREV